MLTIAADVTVLLSVHPSHSYTLQVPAGWNENLFGTHTSVSAPHYWSHVS